MTQQKEKVMKSVLRSVLLVVFGVVLLAGPLSLTYAQTPEKPAAVKVEVKAAQPAASQPAVAPAIEVKAEVPKVAAPVEPEAISWWKLLIRYGLELIFSILGLMATIFVTVLMRKYGFENYSAKLNELLSKGIGLAEQKSISAAKLNGKPLESAEKLTVAVNFIQSMAKEYKLPDKGKEWWEGKVDGWLGVQKMNGSK
jgi:hypothetical protein